MNRSTSDNGAEIATQTYAKADPAARRVRMREFQNRLVDRMQSARGGSDARAGQLGVLIGETRWLLDLQQAGEIVAVGAITTVPLTQPWFLGLTNIRGSLISVVDYAHFKHGTPTVIDKQSRIIAFAPALGFIGGMLVSRVLGLRNITDMQQQPNSEYDRVNAAADRRDAPGGGDRRAQQLRFIDSDNQVWQMLDLVVVTQDPRFIQVGA